MFRDKLQVDDDFIDVDRAKLPLKPQKYYFFASSKRCQRSFHSKRHPSKSAMPVVVKTEATIAVLFRFLDLQLATAAINSEELELSF